MIVYRKGDTLIMNGENRSRVELILQRLTKLEQAHSVDELTNEITCILGLLGKYTKADRVFLCDKIENNRLEFANAFEWQDENVEPWNEKFDIVSEMSIPNWIIEFEKNKNIFINDVEEIRHTMPYEYKRLKLNNVRSVIAVPIMGRNSFLGIIGIDNPRINVSELFLSEIKFIGAHIISVRNNINMVNELELKQAEQQKNIAEMEKERQNLLVLCRDSTSVYRMNLMNDTAEIVKLDMNANASIQLMEMVNTRIIYSKEMEKYYNNFVIKESAPDMRKMFDVNYLMQELSDKDSISYRFQSRPNNNGNRYFEMRITRISRSEDSFVVLADFRSVDRVIEEERRQRALIEKALAESRMSNDIISSVSKIYFAMYHIDLTNDSYDEISRDTSIHKLSGKNGSAAAKMKEICNSFVAEEYREKALKFFNLTTLSERLKYDETDAVEYFAADGNWHLARFISHKRDKNGVTTEALCVIRLISEEKRREKYWIVAAEEANKANKAKSEFLSRISHDIRTPMNVIMGFTNIAEKNIENTEKLKDCLDKIEMSGKNLEQLIDDVLDMSKIENDSMQLVPQQTSVSEIFEFYKSTAAGSNKQLNYEFVKHDIEHEYLMVDKLRLNQININLLSNAVKYTNEGGSIHFEIYEEKSPKENMTRLVSIVSDTGIGMSEEFMEVMYSEFSRAVDTRVNTVRGSGLGLAIVKKLVDIMGGTIEAKSKINEGTTFKVVIDVPYCDEADVVDTEDNTPVEFDRTVNILIAEDNDLNYEILCEQLSDYDISCTRAKNGVECVSEFKNSKPHSFDIILMDMQMPVMNGLDAAAAIRALDFDEARTIPIIAVTANAYNEDIEKCLAVGMNAHCSKPIDIEKLMKIIGKYLK